MRELPPPDSQDPVAFHYDQLDRFYRYVWGTQVHHGCWVTGRESLAEAQRIMVDQVGALLQIQTGERLLDVGCGYGATAHTLANRTAADITGVTISQAQWKYAQENYSITREGGCVFLHQDWMTWAGDASYDAVLAVESLEHMPDLDRVLALISESLRSGGRLVACICMLGAQSPRWWHRWLLGSVATKIRYAPFRSWSDYSAAFQKAGFNVVEMRDLSAQVWRTWPVQAGMALRRLSHRPGLLRYFGELRHGNCFYPIAMFRIWLAYRLGILRYGIIRAERS